MCTRLQLLGVLFGLGLFTISCSGSGTSSLATTTATPDLDADGVADTADLDRDGDGISNLAELQNGILPQIKAQEVSCSPPWDNRFSNCGSTSDCSHVFPARSCDADGKYICPTPVSSDGQCPAALEYLATAPLEVCSDNIPAYQKSSGQCSHSAGGGGGGGGHQPEICAIHVNFEICGDGIDNDGNDLADCDDSAVCDCQNALGFRTLHGPQNTEFDISNYDFPCGDTTGIRIEEGRFLNNLNFSEDAFDGAAYLGIGSEGYYPTTYASLSSGLIATSPMTLSNLEVSAQYAALQHSSTIRVLFALHNPTEADIDTTAQLQTNLGSDYNTFVEATSSSDLVWTEADRWVVTGDQATYEPDPIILQVLQGPGTVQSPLATVAQCDGTPMPNHQDYSRTTYAIHVPAGQTRYLMVFYKLFSNIQTAQNTFYADSVADAITDATSEAWSTNPTDQDERLSNIDPTIVENILNWNLAGSCPANESLTCGDGIDNDFDGDTDCADSDCSDTAACQQT